MQKVRLAMEGAEVLLTTQVVQEVRTHQMVSIHGQA